MDSAVYLSLLLLRLVRLVRHNRFIDGYSPWCSLFWGRAGGLCAGCPRPRPFVFLFPSQAFVPCWIRSRWRGKGNDGWAAYLGVGWDIVAEGFLVSGSLDIFHYVRFCLLALPLPFPCYLSSFTSTSPFSSRYLSLFQFRREIRDTHALQLASMRIVGISCG